MINGRKLPFYQHPCLFHAELVTDHQAPVEYFYMIDIAWNGQLPFICNQLITSLLWLSIANKYVIKFMSRSMNCMRIEFERMEKIGNKKLLKNLPMMVITMVLICQAVNSERESSWKFPFVMMIRCHWIGKNANFDKKSCVDAELA